LGILKKKGENRLAKYEFKQKMDCA